MNEVVDQSKILYLHNYQFPSIHMNELCQWIIGSEFNIVTPYYILYNPSLSYATYVFHNMTKVAHYYLEIDE